MLPGQMQRSIFLQRHTSNIVRDDRKLLLQFFTSFSPNLTILSQLSNFNFLNFTRNLLATASDSHKYRIALQSVMVNSSTALRCLITSLHSTSISLEI
ncbi:hypothetical protein HanRHA438_Chr13g0620291 [Helianthus annuus]|nr:hypothetical protein HanRHA438_Chr13g0620291 [Helianthus annuus]